MKRLLTIGAAAVAVVICFLLIPNTFAGATAADFQMEGTTLVNYTGTASTVSIPNNVETIGRSAFENNNVVKKIMIPDTVETIEEYAFWGCSKLETVVFGDGLYEVADFAFASCENLKEVSISASIRRIGIMAFADCTSLTDIYIPDTVTDIHATAFDGVYFLNIRAPQYSYSYNYAIARGDALANVPEYLRATPVPTEVPLPQVTQEPTATPVPTATPIPGVVIGSTSIVGNNAVIFMDNETMKTLQGYEGMEYIEDEKESATPIPVIIEDWTYYGDDSLINIELGRNVSAIGSFAFSRSNLRTITIPEGTETIEYAAFYHCDALKDVVIPDTVTYIGEKAFAFTPWLESFYDGSMVLEENSDFLIVGDGVLIAYRGNDENVELPDEVKHVTPDAFRR